MFTRLFNRAEVEAYWLDHDEDVDPDEAATGEHDHTFGGEARHEGATPPGCDKPVHLFYHLDLSDPLVGVRFPDSNLRHLPLYYALGNLGGPFRYRVVSDDRIELFCQPYPKKFRAGILTDFLEPLAPAHVDLLPLGYDRNNPQNVWDCGGVLGIAGLTARQESTLQKNLERWHLETIGSPLVEKDDGDEPDPPLAEIVAGCTPFTQGMPQEKCPNPQCKESRGGAPLPPLLLLEPDTEDEFYEIVAGGDGGQLIWQVCRSCASVVATNPCT